MESPHPFELTRAEIVAVVVVGLLTALSLTIAAHREPPQAEPVQLERIDTNISIDVNRCVAGYFCIIRGIGEKRAEQIVDEREENGPFASIDDMLARLPVLKQTDLEKFSAYLSFSR